LKKVIPLIIGLAFLFVSGSYAASDDVDVTHTVKKGDTLWDISNKYLSTPWKWPLVWSENTNITNPHLIYPGDRVVIFRQDGKVSIKVIPVGKEDAVRIYSIDDITKITDKSIFLSPVYSTLIYSAEPLKSKGVVVGKVEIGFLSSQGDKILVKGYKGAKPGQGLIIKSLLDTVQDIDNVYGYLYKIIATATIEKVDGEVATCTIDYAFQEVSNKDLVDDKIEELGPVTISLSENEKIGYHKIVDIWGGAAGSGTGDVFYIDGGSTNGINKGNLLNVYKTVDVKLGKKDVGIYESVGTAVVLQTIEKSTLVLLVNSTQSVEEGFSISGNLNEK